jgi:hypothetical protein
MSENFLVGKKILSSSILTNRYFLENTQKFYDGGAGQLQPNPQNEKKMSINVKIFQ